MIPKIIHYCWLSDEPFPTKIQACMESWKKVMPDYEWKLWSSKNFDIDYGIPYVKEAFANKKWAFVADYIRLYALYTDGGIYLDSDVKVLKRFDDFLNHRFFSCIEYHAFQVEQNRVWEKIDKEGNRIVDEYINGVQIQAAVMGAEKGCPFVGELLEWYKDKHFIKEDGSMGMDVIAPQIYARVAEKYGFKYLDKDQDLRDDVKIFRSEIFAGNQREATPASYAIHFCENSWVKTSWWNKLSHYGKFAWFLIKQRIKTNNL